MYPNCEDLIPDLGVVGLSPLGWGSASILFVHALVALWWRDGLIVLHLPAASLWRFTRPNTASRETNVRHMTSHKLDSLLLFQG